MDLKIGKISLSKQIKCHEAGKKVFFCLNLKLHMLRDNYFGIYGIYKFWNSEVVLWKLLQFDRLKLLIQGEVVSSCFQLWCIVLPRKYGRTDGVMEERSFAPKNGTLSTYLCAAKTLAHSKVTLSNCFVTRKILRIAKSLSLEIFLNFTCIRKLKI